MRQFHNKFIDFSIAEIIFGVRSHMRYNIHFGGIMYIVLTIKLSQLNQVLQHLETKVIIVLGHYIKRNTMISHNSTINM